MRKIIVCAVGASLCLFNAYISGAVLDTAIRENNPLYLIMSFVNIVVAIGCMRQFNINLRR